MQTPRSCVVVVPGSIETRTGGYEYDRRIVGGLRDLGWTVDVRELDASFPRPSPSALDQAGRVLAAIPDNTLVVIDGLALGAMPDEIEREGGRLRIVALIHLPLAAEIGIGRETVVRFQTSERRALAAVACVIVTGKRTADALASYGVGRERITVVEPGTDRAPLARGSREAFIHLVSVAALIPGKGHDVLVRALAQVPQRNWRLTCAGSLERHPPTVERLRAMVRADGLEDRVSLAGDLHAPALAALYDSADVFVLATLHETYGMAVAEALARGLPVVSTTTGAIPDLVRSDEDVAGLLVPPGDVSALAEAVSAVLGDVGVRERLAAAARRVRDGLPTWESAARQMAAVLERLETDRRVAN